MATEVAIAEPMQSTRVRIYWQITLKSASGEPVADTELRVTLVGDGSLAPQFDSKEVVRRTDENGVCNVTWFRRNIWTRMAKATMTIVPPDESLSAELEELAEAPQEMVGPKMEWTPQRRRWSCQMR